MTTEPTFPLEDFADEMRACVRVLRRWDVDAEHPGTMVRCPSLADDGSECGYRLHYRDMGEQVTCRRCGQTRDASTLALIALQDGRDVWLDPEAAARHLAVDEAVLRRWAQAGRIKVSHGRYLLSSIEAAIQSAKGSGYAHLARLVSG
jgi:hypothetical protein